MYWVSRISWIACKVLLIVWKTLKVGKNQLKWQLGRHFLILPDRHHMFTDMSKSVKRRSFSLMPNCITVFLKITAVKFQMLSTFHGCWVLSKCQTLLPDHSLFLLDPSSYSSNLNPSCLIILSTSSWQANIKSKMSHFSEFTIAFTTVKMDMFSLNCLK